MHRDIVDYCYQVEYEVWCRGGNPDRVDLDRVDDAFYDGVDIDLVVDRELESQRHPSPDPDDVDVDEDWGPGSLYQSG